MSAADIAAALGDARIEGRAWRCRCPLHGGGSLVLRDGDGGRLLATCWGGCDRLDVLAELRRLGLLAGDRGHRLDLQHRGLDRPRDREDVARRLGQARRILDASQTASGSPVVRYLAGRGITMPPPSSLRWTPRCWHAEARDYLPAMVAIVEHVERGVVGAHRTYLTPELRRHGRASLGPIRGGAVRLGTPHEGEWLLVGEGVETTMSVMVACAMPGWAALSASGIRALVLPPEATHVLVCADHDAHGVGQRAADDAAARWLAEGRRVKIAIPPEPDTDFNDVLTDAAATTMEARNVA